MKTGVIMATLGGPRNLEEIPEFIKNFTGRELPIPAMNAVVERYRLIGGFSPLPSITEAQAQKLNTLLGDDYLCLPAFRYSLPSIEDALQRMNEDDIGRVLFLILSPFYTSVTTGNYINAAKAYLEKNTPKMSVDFIHSWYREPLFIGSWVKKIKAESFDGQAFYLFSVHSLPEKLAGEPYRQQIEETVTLIAAQTGIANYGLGWQSIPNNVMEPWIAPTVEEKIASIASSGFRSVVQVPVGFTADNIETLYDIDVVHKVCALEQGLSFRRLSSLNTGEPFIRALKEIITRRNMSN